jgi:hypothetical protein
MAPHRMAAGRRSRNGLLPPHMFFRPLQEKTGPWVGPQPALVPHLQQLLEQLVVGRVGQELQQPRDLVDLGGHGLGGLGGWGLRGRGRGGAARMVGGEPPCRSPAWLSLRGGRAGAAARRARGPNPPSEAPRRTVPVMTQAWRRHRLLAAIAAMELVLATFCASSRATRQNPYRCSSVRGRESSLGCRRRGRCGREWPR